MSTQANVIIALGCLPILIMTLFAVMAELNDLKSKWVYSYSQQRLEAAMATIAGPGSNDSCGEQLLDLEFAELHSTNWRLDWICSVWAAAFIACFAAACTCKLSLGHVGIIFLAGFFITMFTRRCARSFETSHVTNSLRYSRIKIARMMTGHSAANNVTHY